MEYVPGQDILDIWFDSGTSWSYILPGNFFSFNLVILFVRWVGEERRGDRFFPVSVYSPNAHKSWGWAVLKPGSRNSKLHLTCRQIILLKLSLAGRRDSCLYIEVTF